MNFKKLAVLAGLVCAAASASATVTKWGTASGIEYGAGATLTGSDFIDYFTFTLASTSSLATIAHSGTISSAYPADFFASTGTVYLYSGVAGDGIADTLKGSFAIGSGTTFTGLSAGKYYFEVSGTGVGSSGVSTYGIKNTVSAVPEPANVAMLLAGLGMMGFVARRRKN